MIADLGKAYVPALRMKKGERKGLMDLAGNVADRILPRLIVPPPGERDDALQSALFAEGRAPDIAAALRECWYGRPVLVETTHMMRDPGLGSVGEWLPGMFHRARRAGIPAIPLVRATNLDEAVTAAHRAASAPGPIALSVVATPDEVDGPDAVAALVERLHSMGVAPPACALIVDFSGYDLTDPELVAPIAIEAITRLLSEAVWAHIVFQGTNYPECNKAPPGGRFVVDRNEWRAWEAVLEDDPDIAKHVLFGDYAADCAKMRFDKGGRPIPHLRYATPRTWLVERGRDDARQTTAMREVCRRIVDDRDFDGEGFSLADERIAKIAADEADPGDATTWRAINTTRHLTRVIADLGPGRGFELQRRAARQRPTQAVLFD
jgi:hypothetical protein